MGLLSATPESPLIKFSEFFDIMPTDWVSGRPTYVYGAWRHVNTCCEQLEEIFSRNPEMWSELLMRAHSIVQYYSVPHFGVCAPGHYAEAVHDCVYKLSAVINDIFKRPNDTKTIYFSSEQPPGETRFAPTITISVVDDDPGTMRIAIMIRAKILRDGSGKVVFPPAGTNYVDTKTYGHLTGLSIPEPLPAGWVKFNRGFVVNNDIH